MGTLKGWPVSGLRVNDSAARLQPQPQRSKPNCSRRVDVQEPRSKKKGVATSVVSGRRARIATLGR